MRILLCLLILLGSYINTGFAQMEIYVNIPAYTLTLIDTDNSQVIKEYNIAVGTPYEQTPTGTFHIFFKEKYPTWIPGANFNEHDPVAPGPDNPLGTRWMEFKTNYGIHGTNKGWDISYPVSGGCIRMQDADACDLYEKVDIGTPVVIRYETMLLVEKPDGLYLKVLPDIYNTQANTPEHFMMLIQPYMQKYTVIQVPHGLQSNPNAAYEVKVAALPKK